MACFCFFLACAWSLHITLWLVHKIGRHIIFKNHVVILIIHSLIQILILVQIDSSKRLVSRLYTVVENRDVLDWLSFCSRPKKIEFFHININIFNVKKRYLPDGPPSRPSQGMAASQLPTGLCSGPRRQRPVKNWVRRCQELRYAREDVATRSWLRLLRIQPTKSPGRHRWDHKNRIRYYVPAHLALCSGSWPWQLRCPRVQMLYLSLLGRGRHPSLEDREPVS